MQVIGCVFNDLSLLEYTDKYSITEEDFPDQFHKIVFGSIYKIHEMGAKQISLENIVDFLSSRPKSEAIFKQNKGEEWILRVADTAVDTSFDYYYNRLKRFSLLRAYDKYGIDVSDIYDPDNIMDTKKRQEQEEYLDNSTLEQIALKVEGKIEDIRLKYVNDDFGEAAQAGEGIFELIQKFKDEPEVGVPLYGKLINTITRGARLKKFYLRSAATGTGKTRSMIADACFIGCGKYYDDNFGWITSGPAQPVLFITTEQELSEVQTMMLAFLSNVNEEHILNGLYAEGEEERVIKAGEILEQSPIYIEELPDFSLKDVEDKIKKGLREYNIKYVFNSYRVLGQ